MIEKRSLHQNVQSAEYGITLAEAPKARPSDAPRKFCHNCGAALEIDDRFCYQCGAQQKIRPAAQAADAPPAVTQRSDAQNVSSPGYIGSGSGAAFAAAPAPQRPPELEQMIARQMIPPVMDFSYRRPKEPNQYNFRGKYPKYFASVFAEAFPDYEVTQEPDTVNKYERDAAIFVFRQNGRVCLKVEVMSESSSSQKIRKECEAAGIGYLRFYHDHETWWNTKAYVVCRVRTALEEHRKVYGY